MKFGVGAIALAASIITPGLALSQELTANQKSESAYGEYDAARRTCHLAATPKWNQFVDRMSTLEGVMGREEAGGYYDLGAAVFERNLQTKSLALTCDFYIQGGWLTQTSDTPSASTSPRTVAPITAPTARPAQVITQTRNVEPPVSSNDVTVSILVVVLFVYTLISGIIMLPFVRPKLMNWYQSQQWFTSGTGPVDILFKQIGYRVSFEVFIFSMACLVGALGGVWIRAFKRKQA